MSDYLVILHKCWIQEWGEIERTFSKKHCEELKAFITRRSDTFRPPYGRTAFENPRQNIIVGTANSTEFLVDATGNRRYWIIPIVKDKIPLDMLREERDSIWSAAVKAYRNGESWWLTDAEEALSRGNNQKFQIIDEWQGATQRSWLPSAPLIISNIVIRFLSLRFWRRSWLLIWVILTDAVR